MTNISLAQRARRHPSFVLGALLSLALVLAAFVSLFWSPYPPADIDIPNKLQAPSAAHWFGTDSLGRDIASQLLVGAQNSIVVGVIANLTVWFGLHVLFGSVGEWRAGTFSLPAPDLATFDLAAATIAIAAGLALIRFHQNMIVVIVAAALAGAAWTLL